MDPQLSKQVRVPFGIPKELRVTDFHFTKREFALSFNIAFAPDLDRFREHGARAIQTIPAKQQEIVGIYRVLKAADSCFDFAPKDGSIWSRIESWACYGLSDGGSQLQQDIKAAGAALKLQKIAALNSAMKAVRIAVDEIIQAAPSDSDVLQNAAGYKPLRSNLEIATDSDIKIAVKEFLASSRKFLICLRNDLENFSTARGAAPNLEDQLFRDSVGRFAATIMMAHKLNRLADPPVLRKAGELLAVALLDHEGSMTQLVEAVEKFFSEPLIADLANGEIRQATMNVLEDYFAPYTRLLDFLENDLQLAEAAQTLGSSAIVDRESWTQAGDAIHAALNDHVAPIELIKDCVERAFREPDSLKATSLRLNVLMNFLKEFPEVARFRFLQDDLRRIDFADPAQRAIFVEPIKASRRLPNQELALTLFNARKAIRTELAASSNYLSAREADEISAVLTYGYLDSHQLYRPRRLTEAALAENLRRGLAFFEPQSAIDPKQIPGHLSTLEMAGWVRRSWSEVELSLEQIGEIPAREESVKALNWTRYISLVSKPNKVPAPQTLPPIPSNEDTESSAHAAELAKWASHVRTVAQTLRAVLAQEAELNEAIAGLAAWHNRKADLKTMNVGALSPLQKEYRNALGVIGSKGSRLVKPQDYPFADSIVRDRYYTQHLDNLARILRPLDAALKQVLLENSTRRLLPNWLSDLVQIKSLCQLQDGQSLAQIKKIIERARAQDWSSILEQLASSAETSRHLQTDNSGSANTGSAEAAA